MILDDATSEIYYAQLVEEESTATVMAGLKEVIERKGVFCALYSDRGSHFWLTPKVEAIDDFSRFCPDKGRNQNDVRLGSYCGKLLLGVDWKQDAKQECHFETATSQFSAP